MTIEVEGVFGVVVAALDTPINTNFLLLLWLAVRQFVARKITSLGRFVRALVTPMNFWTFLYSFCLLKKARINAEKTSRVPNCLVHVLLPKMPILRPYSLEHFGAL